MFDYDDIALNLQTKRELHIFAAVGTAVAGAVASTAVGAVSNAIFGGSSGGASSGSSVAPANAPASNVPSVTSQAVPTLSAATPAKTYDPTAQMNNWSSIFNNMITQSDKPSQDIEIPKDNLPQVNVTPDAGSNANTQ